MLARPGTHVETKPGMAGQRGGPCGWSAEAWGAGWCAEAWGAGWCAEAWGRLRRDPALKVASGEPTGRSLCHLGFDAGSILYYPLTQVSPANHFLVTPLLPQTAVG